MVWAVVAVAAVVVVSVAFVFVVVAVADEVTLFLATKQLIVFVLASLGCVTHLKHVRIPSQQL